MNRACQVLRCPKFALHKRFVDDHLGGGIRQFAFLPRFHLLSRGFEVALHSVDSDRDAINQRKRFRVFGEYRSKHAWNNVSEFWVSVSNFPETDFWPGTVSNSPQSKSGISIGYE
jgi:hypothetical protein